MDFDKLVAHYGEVDEHIKSLTRERDGDKDTIKEELAKRGESDYEAGGYKVTRQVSYRTSIDEDKMLKVLKADWAERYGSMDCPYIKTREYVDTDALEAVIYANELSDETMKQLEGCQHKQEVITLKCSKIKKKED